MNKKVIVFGGGTGMSYLLRGLKQYPLDITAVVSVCDDGGSTGKLRTEFDILAPGDIRKVIESLSDNENELSNLLNLYTIGLLLEYVIKVQLKKQSKHLVKF